MSPHRYAVQALLLSSLASTLLACNSRALPNDASLVAETDALTPDASVANDMNGRDSNTSPDAEPDTGLDGTVVKDAAAPVPVFEVVFPTAHAELGHRMTQATIVVRGPTSTEYSVSVGGVDANASHTDTFTFWRASVSLSPGENVVDIEVRQGTTVIQQTSHTLYRRPIFQHVADLAYVEETDELLLTNGLFPGAGLSSRERPNRVVGLQVTSGDRRVVAANEPDGYFAVASDIVVDENDPTGSTAYVLEAEDAIIFKINLASGESEPFYHRMVTYPFHLLSMKMGKDALFLLNGTRLELRTIDLATGAFKFVSARGQDGWDQLEGVANAMAVDGDRNRIYVTAGRDIELLSLYQTADGDPAEATQYTIPARLTTLRRGSARRMGPWFPEGPLDIVLSSTGNTAYLIGQRSPEILAMDTETGETSRISGLNRGNGPLLVAPKRIALDRKHQRIFIADVSGVFSVDITSGDRQRLVDLRKRLDESSPIDAAFDANTKRLVVLQQSRTPQYYINGTAIGFEGTAYGDTSLVAFDFPGGEPSILSSRQHGDGPLPEHAYRMIADFEANRVYLFDAVVPQSQLIAVDLTTGNRSFVSYGDEIGSGPHFPETANPRRPSRSLYGCPGRTSSEVFVVDSEGGRVVALDVGTGVRELVASPDDAHGDNLTAPRSCWFDRTLDRLIVQDMGQTSSTLVYVAIDVNQGLQRQPWKQFNGLPRNGNLPRTFFDPATRRAFALAPESAVRGGELWELDFEQSALRPILPSRADQLADDWLSVTGSAIAVDIENQRLFVPRSPSSSLPEYRWGGVFVVDALTGDRALAIQ